MTRINQSMGNFYIPMGLLVKVGKTGILGLPDGSPPLLGSGSARYLGVFVCLVFGPVLGHQVDVSIGCQGASDPLDELAGAGYIIWHDQMPNHESPLCDAPIICSELAHLTIHFLDGCRRCFWVVRCS